MGYWHVDMADASADKYLSISSFPADRYLVWNAHTQSHEISFAMQL